MEPPNLQRLAVLRSNEHSEQCVLAISQGPVATVVEADLIGPDDFVAMVSFLTMGPGFWRTEADGKPYWIQPILDGPTKHKSHWSRHRTAAEALEVIEREKVKLLAAGWKEAALDPVNDPD